jgi:hypothetical protein
MDAATRAELWSVIDETIQEAERTNSGVHFEFGGITAVVYPDLYNTDEEFAGWLSLYESVYDQRYGTASNSADDDGDDDDPIAGHWDNETFIPDDEDDSGG